MARRERPLDPGAGELHRFAIDLRRLRVAAGNPTYRVLARTAGYSATTLSQAAAGYRQPTLDVVLAYVGACGGDRGTWARRWHRLDAVLRPPPAAAPADAPYPVPRQLPAAATHFTGRAAELGRLTALTRPAGADERAVPIAVVDGTAGVGKTALVVHWAHRAAPGFPDGQLYADLRGHHPGRPLPPADVLTRFLVALGHPGPLPGDLDELAARYRTTVAGRRILIVLDDATSVPQVRPLLPATASCAVVVTSRDSLAGLVAVHGARRVELDPPPAAEAQDLLRRALGPRAATDATAVAALAERCARLPLAVRIVAGAATARPGVPLADLVADLAARQPTLDPLDAGATVTAVFAWSVRRLEPGPAALFALLGVHPGPDLEASAAAALAGTDVEAAGRGLDALARAGLIHPTTPGRFALHDLLRAYAIRLAGPAERAAARGRLFDHYLSTAALAMDRLCPADVPHRPPIPRVPGAAPTVADAAAARRRLDAERPALVALAGSGTGHVVPLSAVLFPYLDGCHLADALAIHGHAYAVARRAGDLTGQADALRGLGSTDMWLGRPESAAERLRQALRMFLRAGDRRGQARTELSLGLLARRQGRFGAAAGHHERSLALSRQAADPVGEGRALTNLGINDARLGRHHSAAERLRQALALCRRIGDESGEAHTLTNLGLVDQRVGSPEAAAARHRRAAVLFRRLGNRHGEAHTLDNLGSLYLSLGRHRPAERYLERALAVFRDVGDRGGQARTRNGLGDAARLAGRYPDAVTAYTAALSLAEAVGNPEQQARAHDGLGRALHGGGDVAGARHHFAQALARYTELDLGQAQAVRARLAAVGGAGSS